MSQCRSCLARSQRPPRARRVTRREGGLMSGYAVAHLDEIDEQDDGRQPYRPVRHHFGITAFGVNAWTARDAGDRIINEHDESNPDGNEELYLVLQGHAVFELDGERVDAPAGTLVFARPGVKRTAFAEEPGTTIVAIGGTPGKAYEPDRLGALGPTQARLRGGRVRRGGRPASRPGRGSSAVRPACSSTSRAARASPAGRPTRSTTSGGRSTCRRCFARTQGTIRTSMRSATSPPSRN